jgi:hypothetical protein
MRLVLAFALALNIAASATWVGPAQAAPASSGYGYVWLDDPARPIGSEYTPSLSYQFNSTQATNTVIRRGTGNYDVYFPSLQRFGSPSVTPYGVTAGQRCKIGNWRASTTIVATAVNVRCTTRSGSPANVRFSVSYTHQRDAFGSGAYLWSNIASPVLNQEYIPAVEFQYSTAGGTNAVMRLATGFYRVRFGGIAPGPVSGLTVAATGTASPGTYCRAVQLQAGGGSDRTVDILCRNSNHTNVDTAFAVSMVNSGNSMFAPVAFAAHSFILCEEADGTCEVRATTNGTVSVTRVAAGQYEIAYPNPLNTGNVQIGTFWALNNGAGLCSVSWWGASTVAVRCVDPATGNAPTGTTLFWVNYVA